MHTKITVIGLSFCLMVTIMSSCIKQHRDEDAGNQEIILSLDEMLLYPEHLRDTVFCPKFKYVVYVDSMECSPCKIAHLGIWNYFRNELADNCAALYMIIATSRDMVHEIQEIHNQYRHRTPVYIDTLGVFERDNPQIASMTTEYHSFLLDENNRIVVVGDASMNHYVRDKIYRTISDNANNAITEK